ncbi:MAG TPA: metallophosphoesterase [Acidobacteriota bacterium]|nr:metallophosphoesterase [Acidobacteriota bacterium]HQF86804.1 metallophosphoesterase [Acidobacteriota bacterium]HQG91398.1 metallophosphoesterase [Acidobacteriota bacterium]HQK87346.1 metallophosphoesterase [Acidobacteriota bacterium]
MTSVRFLIPLAICIGLDIYAYQAVRVIANRWRTLGWARRAYWWVHALFYLALVVTPLAAMAGHRLPPRGYFYLITVFVLLYVPKLAAAAVLLLEDASRMVRWIWQRLARWLRPAPSPVPAAQPAAGINRKEFLSLTAVALAGIPLAGIVHGVVRARYAFTVRRERVALPGLPPAFDGFRILQLSDIHVGSFDDLAAVRDGITLANAQGADLIVFTGDLVNDVVDEVGAYGEVFAALRAPLGVLSVLGNHDYGDYHAWPSDREHAAHFQRMLDCHEALGWRLLRNEHAVFARGDDRLAVIGVENWSNRHGFHKRGDLERATRGLPVGAARILLTHDPSHWDSEVRPNFGGIGLTLSGHTHGFQFGVEVPGFRWSPVQYMYRQWAGLYREGGQYLYVNRGFGHVAFMGRVGIRPEIAVIELVRESPDDHGPGPDLA